jgi:hypothetical protein
MFNLAQLADSAAAMTSLVDVAAAVETRLHDAEVRVQILERELRHAQQRQDRARQWITTIRRHHRTKSHALTGRVIKAALVNLASLEPGCFLR